MDIAKGRTGLSCTRSWPGRLWRSIRQAGCSPVYAPTVIRQRVALRMTGVGIRTVRALAPWTVNLVPELRCDLRCSYCSNHATVKACHQGLLPMEWLDPLPLPMWQIMLRRLAPWRPWLNIGGGEPLQYPGILDLLRAARRYGMRASMTTNGTRLGEHADVLAESDLLLLGVSLDGPPEIHDRITGRIGAFASTAEGLERFLRARRKAGRTVPPVKAIFTICSENYDCVADGVAEILRLRPDRISLRHYMFTPNESIPTPGTRVLGEPVPIGFPFGGVEAQRGWPEIDAPRLLSEIATAQAQGTAAGIPVAVEPGFTEDETLAYYGGRSPKSRNGMGCSVPWHVMEVYPNGDVIFCGVFLYRGMGNLLRSHPKEVWNGARARTLRSALRRDGIFSFCSHCCGTLV